MNAVITWFDIGGTLRLDETVDSASAVAQLGSIQGLMEKTGELGLSENEQDAVRAAAAEFVLEGLYAHRRIARSETLEYQAGERRRERDRPVADDEEDPRQQRRSKRQYQ